MNTAFVVIGSVFVVLAVVIHVFIFLLESVLWSRPATWKRFGVRGQEEADILKPMAYNQGFYNVFLALGAGTGLVMLGSTNVPQAGLALAIFSLLSMLLAALVLITSNRRLARAAVLQGAAPLLGIVFLVLGVVA